MPTLPPPPAIKLTPAEAAAIAKRGRKLMRAGRITHCQWAVLDCLLWSCRSPATGAIVVSFSGLQKLAHVSRATVSSAIQALEKLRVLRGSSGASDASGTRAASRADRRPTPMCSIHPATQSSTAELYIRAIELNFSTFSSSRQPTAPPQRPHSLNNERSCRKDCSRQGAAGPSEPPDRTPGPRAAPPGAHAGHFEHHVPRKRAYCGTQPDYRSRRIVAHGESRS
jgi:hypothetical protein